MNRPAGHTHIKEFHPHKICDEHQITMINIDYVKELFKTCIREIQETDEGNTQFKRMRGSNLEAAAKLAELVKDVKDEIGKKEDPLS